MKVRFIQMEIVAGDPQKNAEKMIESIRKARREGVEGLFFPELCVPGYLIGDLWESYDFLKDCEYWDLKISRETQDLFVVWGSVGLDWEALGEDGHIRRFNSYKIAQNGSFLIDKNTKYPFFSKILSPNYRLFDEHRYFYDLRKWAFETGQKIESLLTVHTLNKYPFAITLCEDGWDEYYSVQPMQILQEQEPVLHVNLSCSPFGRGKAEKRHRVFARRAEEFLTPIVYLNAVTLQNTGKTIYAFDGRSTLYQIEKEPKQLGALYAENEFDLDIGSQAISEPQKVYASPQSESEMIFHTLKYQISNYLNQAHLKRVVIGASGGVDSAVCAALMAQIVGPENLLLVNMPSRFNSTTTKDLAWELAQNLGCWYTVVGIEESLKLSEKQLGKIEIANNNDKTWIELSPFHFENVQARDRSARILSALACSFGGVFTCNANKAEMSVGYSTLYGDLGGFLAPLADLWKGEVYELGHFFNRKNLTIPVGVFSVIPSAELSENHNVDQGKGDPLVYWYHDALFRSWVEDWNKKTPADILESYLEGTLNEKLGLTKNVYELFATGIEFVEDLEKWWKLFRGLGVVKRIQAPPVCAISRRPFGFDFREAIMPPPFSRKFLDLRGKLTLNEE